MAKVMTKTQVVAHLAENVKLRKKTVASLLKALVTDLVLFKGETLVMDMEAGIEHLGRATVAAVDALIVVVEPGRRSVEVACAIRRLAQEIGIRKTLAVGNKVQTAEHRRFLEEAMDGLPLLGCISYHPELARADLEGRPAFESAPAAVQETQQIYRSLLKEIGQA